MITHSLVQGSAEWLAHRRQFFNASDAPAMMGCSPYKTRDQLLHEMHTGLTQEVDGATQRRFDDGHRYEALARPHAAAIVGEDLFPVTGSEGKLSASFDGLTMGEDVAFEHKTLNADLRAAIRQEGGNANDFLALAYRVQMEQQLMVSGAEKVLFVASKWDGDTLEELRHCWYTSDPALRAQIAAGWDQFDADLCAYVPIEVLDKPIIIARRPDQLPSLRVEVKGELVLESNVKEWGEAALAYIKDVSDHELKTDEDFENADAAAKWCVTSKTTLQGVRANLMGATGPVNVGVDTVDRIIEQLDKTRIAFIKQIDARKAARKGEMLVEHQTLLGDYLRAKNAILGRDFMPQITVDFAGAIHGKRSFDSMAAALNGALANGKIEANRVADKIAVNLRVMDEKAKDHGFLFNDLSTLVLMENDHFALMVNKRISDHVAAKQAEEERTRELIRAEEKTKAEREAREKLLAEQEAERKAVEAAKPVEAVAAPAPAPAPVVASIADKIQDVVRAATPPVAAPAPAARQPVKVDGPPTLSLGQIGTRLGFSLTAAFLSSLGFEGEKVKGAVLFHEHQFDDICVALIKHVQEARQPQTA